MRGAVVLVLAACGRIGFDGTGAPLVDGGITGTPALCSMRTLAPLPFNASEDAVSVRATVADVGYAVAINTNEASVFVARVPSSLDTAEIHLPAVNYILGGLSTTGGRPIMHLVSINTSYLKILEADFDSYQTIDDGDEVLLDPATAPGANGKGWRLNIKNGVLDIAALTSAGTKTGLVSSYSPPSEGATIDDNRVVNVNDMACETVLIDEAGAAHKAHVRTDCADPRVAVLANGRGMMVYRGPLGQVLYRIPEAEQEPEAMKVLGDLRTPRLVADGSAAWLLYTKGTTTELARLDGDLNVSAAPVIEVKSPFDLTATAVFWVENRALRVATPCLR